MKCENCGNKYVKESNLTGITCFVCGRVLRPTEVEYVEKNPKVLGNIHKIPIILTRHRKEYRFDTFAEASKFTGLTYAMLHKLKSGEKFAHRGWRLG